MSQTYNALTAPVGTSPRTNGADSVDRVSHAIVEMQPYGYQRMRFVLENGQVWVTTEAKPVRVRNRKDGQPNQVTIRKAAFGSHLLTINDSKRSYRVRRLN